MKMIHFIWLDPLEDKSIDSIPDFAKRNIDRFLELHPNYAAILWDHAKILRDFEDQPNLLQAFKNCRFEAMKSDLMRVAIIAKYGGVYSDLKNEPSRPFLDEIIGSSSPVILEHPPTIKNYNGILCNAFLHDQQGSPFCSKVAAAITGNVLARRTEGGVINVTGINVWKRELFKLSKDEYIVIPSVVAWNYFDSNGWMKRSSATYNGNDMSLHWSRRQKTESLYNE
ncbi:MAG: glycosyltransferase [Hydrogenophaga sp.]|nr:glycosyltransferase [Hydrogenophaga sp.]